MNIVVGASGVVIMYMYETAIRINNKLTAFTIGLLTTKAYLFWKNNEIKLAGDYILAG